MKKALLLFLLVLIGTTSTYAQSTPKVDKMVTEENELKPSKGNILTELNVNPFKGDVSLNNSLNQIKLRYFTSDKVALRIGFNVSNKKMLEDYNIPYGSNPQRYKDERKSTTLGLNVGLERHFLGSKRISPYIGVDISIENKSSNQELINGQTTIKVKNGWYGNAVPPNNINTLIDQAYTAFGVDILSGFDFYVVKNFFFGYEFNLGFSNKEYKTPDVTVSGGSSSNVTSDQKNTSFSFGPRLMNGIRLGYMF